MRASPNEYRLERTPHDNRHFVRLPKITMHTIRAYIIISDVALSFKNSIGGNFGSTHALNVCKWPATFSYRKPAEQTYDQC